MSMEPESEGVVKTLPDNTPLKLRVTAVIDVFVTTSFIGFHKWIDAPDSHSYLRELHRHKFNVKVFARVDHNDRDIEFHWLKEQVENALLGCGYKSEIPMLSSCEDIGMNIARKLQERAIPVSYIQVDEDGENGMGMHFTYEKE